MNSHQQQLLQILQIKPMQLHADFLHFQPFNETAALVSATASTLDSNVPNTSADIVLSEQIPVEFVALAADIQLALQGYLSDLPWRWSAQLQQCVLHAVEKNHVEIHTPDLATLTIPMQKQQLWQFLSQHSGNDEAI